MIHLSTRVSYHYCNSKCSSVLFSDIGTRLNNKMYLCVCFLFTMQTHMSFERWAGRTLERKPRETTRGTPPERWVNKACWFEVDASGVSWKALEKAYVRSKTIQGLDKDDVVNVSIFAKLFAYYTGTESDQISFYNPENTKNKKTGYHIKNTTVQN